MQKKEPIKVSSVLNMISSPELSKSVAQDLSIPDPTGIIAKTQRKANENSQKHDGRASGFHNIEDLFPPSK
jgi:hypothetical protein